MTARCGDGDEDHEHGEDPSVGVTDSGGERDNIRYLLAADRRTPTGDSRSSELTSALTLDENGMRQMSFGLEVDARKTCGPTRLALCSLLGALRRFGVRKGSLLSSVP